MAPILCKLLSICCLLLCFLCFSVAWKHQIRVSSWSGYDNISCLTNSSTPCKTLAFVLDNDLKSSTIIDIENGTYYLDKVYNIKEKQNISIIGDGSEVKIKCNSTNTAVMGSGISWLLSDDIVLNKLSFDSCSFLNQIPPLEKNSTVYQTYGGLIFTYCRNIELNLCTFKNSLGVAVVMYDTGGNVNVTNSTFMNNGAWKSFSRYDSHVHESGTGMLVFLTQYGSLYPYNDTTHEKYSSNNTYCFKDSKFLKNHYNYELLPDVDTPSIFGWGGGLTLIVCGSVQNNNFTIESCHFEENQADWGGGMFTEFHNKAQGNSLLIINNEFWKNKAKFGGGAMRTGNNIIEGQQIKLKQNMIQLEVNRFYSNVAKLGGAMSHYGWTYNQQFHGDNRKISFKKCVFGGNQAAMGSALSVALNNKNNWTEMGNEIPYSVEFTNGIVRDNVAVNDDVTGMGAVYVSGVPFILKGQNSFTNNSNTAFLLDNAPLKVVGAVYFMYNKGYMGGGMAFYGRARLVLTRKSYILFGYNTAKQKGGAWYVRAPGPEVTPFDTTKLKRHQCFVVYDNGHLMNIYEVEKWDTKLEFVHNSAPPFRGNSIYATTLQQCYLPGEESGRNTAMEWEQIISYNISGQILDEISTDPVIIQYRKEEWSNLAPYEQFNATIHLFDEKNSTVSGVVKILVKGTAQNLSKSRYQSTSVSLIPWSSLFLVQPFKDHGNLTKSVVRGLRIEGGENQGFVLKISTVNGQVVTMVSSDMSLGTCRDGFELTKEPPGRCMCMNDVEKHHEGIAHCSTDNKNVYLKTGYWAGDVPNGKNERDFITFPCPKGYCNFKANKTEFMYDKSTICTSGRDSDKILCGACKQNYSLVLGNENCTADAYCDKHVYIIVWGLPVFLIIVPVLVFLLLHLNVDIFTSYLNAWLFFYQIVPFVVQPIDQFDPAMQFILSLVGWQIKFVHISCFLKGMDNITKLAFNFLFPLYVLITVPVIAQITRCYTRCTGKNCFERTNVFRAISTIVVLCYTQVILISLHVCWWARVDSNIDVLLVQGSIYTTREGIDDPTIPPLYYFLLVVAILIIIFFVFALPLALLLRFFLLRRFAFFRNFLNLYDIFDHCYREGCRQFSAYYFIWRIAFLLLTSLRSTPGPYKQCWYEMLTVLCLVVFVYFQPYKKDQDSSLKWLNIVDTVILTDLCMMTIMKSSRNSEASKSTEEGLGTAIKVLSWLPMLYLVVLVVLAVRHYGRAFTAALPTRQGYQSIDGGQPSSYDGSQDE